MKEVLKKTKIREKEKEKIDLITKPEIAAPLHKIGKTEVIKTDSVVKMLETYQRAQQTRIDN